MPTYHGIHWAKKLLPTATSFGWRPDLGATGPDPTSELEVKAVITTMTEEFKGAGTKSKRRKPRRSDPPPEINPADVLHFLEARRRDRHRMILTVLFLGAIYLTISAWIIYRYVNLNPGGMKP